MRKNVLITCLIAFLALPQVFGCKKKSTPTIDSSSDGPNASIPGPMARFQPKAKSKTGGIPLDQFPYDPTKPEIKIELNAFSSVLPAGSPVAKEWEAKRGKVAEVV